MPTTTFDPDTGRHLVELRISAASGEGAAWLAGELADWSTDARPLQEDHDGSLSIVVPLASGRTSRFRSHLGGDVRANDWAADDEVGNELDGTDPVVSVPRAPSRDHAVTRDGTQA